MTFANLYRLDVNALLERRLRTIEEQLRTLHSERRSLGVQPVTSPSLQEGQQLQAPLELGRTPIQDDGVDGMGAVPLRDGADEDEYFGKSLHNCRTTGLSKMLLTLCGNLKAVPLTWPSCE
jgi:hypothetical protein